jgi:hypothetical protein
MLLFILNIRRFILLLFINVSNVDTVLCIHISFILLFLLKRRDIDIVLKSPFDCIGEDVVCLVSEDIVFGGSELS